ncbi:MAG: YHS domain-containing protein [Deltaproteobacteria bacterium]|nr:YHS domain-containing protein [Deltaproteobacteria bacterium]
MNHEFVVTEQSPKVEYEGKTYYFCCPGCVEQFKADPKKYLSKPQS